MSNSSENGNWGSRCYLFEVVKSSEDFMYPINVATALINAIFAVSSSLGNSFILYVIWKTSSLHSPSNVLLSCLAFSDFMVGMFAQPAFVAHKIGELKNNFDLYCATRVTTETVGEISSGVSTLTIAAISVERYLALRLNLRYNEVVTNSRIFIMVGSFWIFFTLAAVSKIFVANINAVYGVFLFVIIMASFLVIFISYILIFRCVMRHQKRINSEQLPTTTTPDGNSQKPRLSFSLLKYKKSTVTMAYILGCYLLFYLPFISVLIVRKFYGYTGVIKAAYVCTSTLIFLNSSANPIIYCWRISDLRIPVKQTLKNLFLSANTVREIKRSSAEIGAFTLRAGNPSIKYRE